MASIIYTMTCRLTFLLTDLFVLLVVILTENGPIAVFTILTTVFRTTTDVAIRWLHLSVFTSGTNSVQKFNALIEKFTADLSKENSITIVATSS